MCILSDLFMPMLSANSTISPILCCVSSQSADIEYSVFTRERTLSHNMRYVLTFRHVQPISSSAVATGVAISFGHCCCVVLAPSIAVAPHCPSPLSCHRAVHCHRRCAHAVPRRPSLSRSCHAVPCRRVAVAPSIAVTPRRPSPPSPLLKRYRIILFE